MSYLQTTATDYNDLVDKVYSFAVSTDTWTGVYNAIADEGTERQIGIEKGNCHVAIGARSGENPIPKTPSGTEALVNMGLATALLSGSGQKKYYGQTGSLVLTATNAARILINDLGEPPFPNVWFFSGSSKKHVHCVVQTSGERYTHFSFGILDAAGQTHPDVAYAVSAYYEWWPNGTTSNDPSASVHSIGHIAESECHVFVPSGVTPGGFTPSGNAVYANTQLSPTMTRVRQSSDHYSTAVGAILDFFFAIGNESTTGGTPLFGLPVLFQETAAASHILLGYLPDVRLVNMGQHTPGETLLYGTEEWLVFPWKRKGLRANLVGGGSPVATANTAEYGFAYKKVP